MNMHAWFYGLLYQQELMECPEDLMRIAGEHMATGWPQVLRYRILEEIDKCYDDPEYAGELRQALASFSASAFMSFRDYHFEVDLDILKTVFETFPGHPSELLMKVVKAMTMEKDRGN